MDHHGIAVVLFMVNNNNYFLLGLEIPSVKVALSVLIISAGTLVTATGAPSVTAFGVALMLLSSGAEAGRLVFTQQLLTVANFSVLEVGGRWRL
jgi:hypothetical protein